MRYTSLLEAMDREPEKDSLWTAVLLGAVHEIPCSTGGGQRSVYLKSVFGFSLAFKIASDLFGGRVFERAKSCGVGG